MKPVPLFLGIESGATRSVAILANARHDCLQRIERAGGANLRLMSEAELTTLLNDFAVQVDQPAAIGIGMAGVIEEDERRSVREAAARVWPGIPCWAGNDLETAFAAAGEKKDGAAARVILISGTGASCYGRNAEGDTALTGGWGHLLGDRGSAHDIALRALRSVFSQFDQTGRWPVLGQRLLRALQLNSPNEIINWAQESSKKELAGLAVEVFAAAGSGDRLAKQVLDKAGQALARTAVACAGRLAPPGHPVDFLTTGSVLLKQPAFARLVKRHVQALWTGAKVRPLEREGAWGAVALAQEIWKHSHAGPEEGLDKGQAPHSQPPLLEKRSVVIPHSRGPSPTEARNPRSKTLDRLSIRAAVQLMLSEEAAVARALRKEQANIVEAVNLIVTAFRGGGRLFYAGAGTSGRLGMLDASECPPTFNVTPDTVQAIMAGGQRALWGSFETAEDDATAGAQAAVARGLSAKDVLVGIAASGRTPFVWGALHQARQAGAKTILVCFNPYLEFSKATTPTLVIAPNVGPEVLTGSTRLKAGTATKLLLNIFSTLSMVRMGKVVENLMVAVQPANNKLRDRAVRIVQELTGRPYETAAQALEKSRWSIAKALARLR